VCDCCVCYIFKWVSQALFDGRHLAWDATVIDTLAASYLQATATTAGAAAAEVADDRKNNKFQ